MKIYIIIILVLKYIVLLIIIIPNAQLMKICYLRRSSGGPKLYFEGDGTTFAYCFISSLRHHYLRHHRPRAVLRKDAQNMQTQFNW